MTGEEKFRLGREIICHENELVNHRMTWLLLVTGFLFSAFFTLIGASDKIITYFGRAYVILASGVIGAVGIFAAVTAAALIAQAHSQVAVIRKWWKSHPDGKADLPPISGEWDQVWWRRLTSTEMLAWFIAIMWLIVLALTVGCLTTGHTSNTP
jgi:hypothetical protein